MPIPLMKRFSRQPQATRLHHKSTCISHHTCRPAGTRSPTFRLAPAALRERTGPAAQPSVIMKSHKNSPADVPVRVLRPEDDPRTIEQCCETIGQAFESEPNNEFFSRHPSLHFERWRAIAANTLLRSRGVPLVHLLEPGVEGEGEGEPGVEGEGEAEGEGQAGGEGQEDTTSGPEGQEDTTSGPEGQEDTTSGPEGQQPPPPQSSSRAPPREVVPSVMLAYQYPEQKVPDDAPEPPGIIDLASTSRPEAVPVRDDLLSYMSTKKAEFLNAHGSFEYIAFLATRPEYWGRGLGSRLLRYVTDKADAAGRWCYLEATNEDNVRLYERHGFRPLETRTWTLGSVPGKRLLLILMARPPAAAVSPHP